MWRHEDVFFALGGGIDADERLEGAAAEDMIARGEAPGPRNYFSIAPLMHGATQWSVMSRTFVGNKNVLVAKFDPDEVWRLVAAEQVQALMITGDAMGRPLVEALEASTEKRDLSSLFLITSTAAVFSPTVKDDFFRHFPNLIIVDGVGASESGGNGLLLCTKGKTAMIGGGPTFKPGPGTVVLDEELRVRRAGLRADRQDRAHGPHPARVLQGSRRRAPRPSSPRPTASATRCPATSRASRPTAR